MKIRKTNEQIQAKAQAEIKVATAYLVETAQKLAENPNQRIIWLVDALMGYRALIGVWGFVEEVVGTVIRGVGQRNEMEDFFDARIRDRISPRQVGLEMTYGLMEHEVWLEAVRWMEMP